MVASGWWCCCGGGTERCCDFVVVLLLLLSIDPPNHWDGLKIPAGMLSVKDGKRIVAMMDLERMDMGGALGLQYYDRHLNK